MLQTVINQLEIIGNIFGGYKEIQKFMPLGQLNYIGSFPGNFLVAAPWIVFEEPIDLKQVGFVKDKEFKVFNQDWDFIYSRKSDGLFQSDPKDKELILNSYHGEYFHLTFSSQGITNIVLLWIVKTFNSQTKQAILDFYRLKENTKYNRVQFNELIIDTSSLVSSSSLEVFCLQGQWSDFLTPQQISSNTQSIKLLSLSSQNSSLYLQPLSNYWYCFRQNNSWLSLVDISGLGQDSWKDSGSFSYFFQPSLVNNSRSSLNSNSLLSFNDSRLQLQASLVYPLYSTLARPALSSTIVSSSPFVSFLSFNVSCLSASVDSLSISVSLSSLSSSSSRSSVNSSLSIIPPSQIQITAASNSATVISELLLQ